VVRRKSKVAYLDPHGIDLNHHLIPDPVSDAIACLLDRVEGLEAQLKGESLAQDKSCQVCDALRVCGHEDSPVPESKAPESKAPVSQGPESQSSESQGSENNKQSALREVSNG